MIQDNFITYLDIYDLEDIENSPLKMSFPAQLLINSLNLMGPNDIIKFTTNVYEADIFKELYTYILVNYLTSLSSELTIDSLIDKINNIKDIKYIRIEYPELHRVVLYQK